MAIYRVPGRRETVGRSRATSAANAVDELPGSRRTVGSRTRVEEIYGLPESRKTVGRSIAPPPGHLGIPPGVPYPADAWDRPNPREPGRSRRGYSDQCNSASADTQRSSSLRAARVAVRYALTSPDHGRIRETSSRASSTQSRNANSEVRVASARSNMTRAHSRETLATVVSRALCGGHAGIRRRGLIHA